MAKLTASQQRYLKNSTLIAASQIIFKIVEEANFPMKELGNLSTVCRGASPRPKGDPKYFGGSIPWIMISDATGNPGKYIYTTQETVTQEGADKSRFLKAGTLIVTNSATIGMPKILGVDGCIHDGFLAFLDVSKEIHLDFLYWFFIYTRTYLERIAPEGTQKNLNTDLARGLRVPVLPITLQKSIGDFLEAVETRQLGNKSLELPDLPPILADVRRIVARVEELAGKVEEARGLRSRALEEAAIAARTIPSYLMAAVQSEVPTSPIGRLISFRNDLIRPIDGKSGALRFIGLQHIESHTGKRIGEDRLLAEELTGRKFKFSPGEVVYGYLRPYLNKVWIADCDGVCSVDQYVIQPNSDLIDTTYLVHFMRSQTFLNQAIELTHNLMLPRLRTALLESITIPLPPLPEQQRIVAYLDDLQAKVDALKRLQAETAVELNALLPSILDKAFKGEL